MTTLGTTDLDVFPLCLGGNVFGWTADEPTSFAILDEYAAAGGNFIDTAESYSEWVPGHTGGESEAIIGRWMADRGNRDSMIVATKVGADRNNKRDVVLERAAKSVERLQSHIDLYYIHWDDLATPLEETLGAFGELVAQGMVRHIGVSNFNAERLAEAVAVVAREGLPPIVAVQNEYNLVARDYEQDARPVAASHNVSAVPYYGLAGGFLTGKYRPGGPEVDSPRASGAAAHLDARGLAVLAALDELAAAHETTQAAVALAWLAAQPTVAAPIASARTTAQLRDLLPFTSLALSAAELERLSRAG